jgi:hypothetical protein
MKAIVLSLIALAGAAAPAFAAFQFFDGSRPNTAPATISSLGLYTDIPARTADTALKFYVVNSALWSDGADKQRWIVLKPGRKIAYDDATDLFTYPDSTVFVKNFLLQRVAGEDTWVLWETRLLVNKNDSLGRNHWYGYSYRWNAQGTDATLVPNGFDTLFTYYPGGSSRPQSYKKWRYPSQLDCAVCHPVGYEGATSARSVAGFFPVQLKRPAPLQPGIDQVQWLFNQGVFSGTPPTGEQLKRRWKGFTEGIPAGLSELERFRVLDTLARSYIGANCTGCHGDRGILAANAVPTSLNWDWFDLEARVEFGAMGGQVLGLDSEDSIFELVQPSRYKFIQAVLRVGLDTAHGSLWNMAYPRDRNPLLITTGFPAYSSMLYRQFGARNAPWIDSVEMRRNLMINGDPQNWRAWIFAQPWGSAAWRDSLAAHNVGFGQVMSWAPDPYQMPRIATYIPDTTAMRVLGEWARSYRTLKKVPGFDSVVSARGRLAAVRAPAPRLEGRLLRVPSDWKGPARMFSVSGRAWILHSAGRGLYAVPAQAPPGVYLFRVGDRAFRASLLR